MKAFESNQAFERVADIVCEIPSLHNCFSNNKNNKKTFLKFNF